MFRVYPVPLSQFSFGSIVSPSDELMTDISKFKVVIQYKEFLYWVCVVEEVFDLKEVLENKKVSLVATRLRIMHFLI